MMPESGKGDYLPMLNVDMTPDERLPIRILQRYLRAAQGAHSRWEQGKGDSAHMKKLMREWNARQDQRAKLLSDAIIKLEKGLSK